MKGERQKSEKEKKTAGDRMEGAGLLQSLLMAVALVVNTCSLSLLYINIHWEKSPYHYTHAVPFSFILSYSTTHSISISWFSVKKADLETH